MQFKNIIEFIGYRRVRRRRSHHQTESEMERRSFSTKSFGLVSNCRRIKTDSENRAVQELGVVSSAGILRTRRRQVCFQ